VGVRQNITEWLNIRPSELRVVVLTFLGAFLIMGFAVLADALRDAFYLGFFDASTLPYILYASVALGIPAVAAFNRQIARRGPSVVMRTLVGAVAAGLLAIYTLVVAPGVELDTRVASVAFYLWTVVATLLLTSAFWIIASEIFAVREAKRLFGLIGAGGALGTLVTGVSTAALLSRIRPVNAIPILVVFLALGLLTFEMIPRDRLRRSAAGPLDTIDRGLVGLRRVFESRHLRLVATIVLLTSAVGYIVTWQLKEAIQVSATTGVAADGLVAGAAVEEVNRRIGAFMGAFRGWTGGLAFVIQVFFASRILTGAGVAWSLAFLPLALTMGSAGFLVLPGLFMATVVRGADNTLGKSLYRTVVELLWVPIPSSVRRRSKAFVDSIIDNAGDGLGALVVLLWVTLGALPSRYLSAFAIGLCLVLLYLSRAMGRQYFATLRARLEDSGSTDGVLDVAGLDRGDRLGATLTRLDITRVLATTGIHLDSEPLRPADQADDDSSGPVTASEILRTGDPALVGRALESETDWTAEDVPALTRLLARDDRINAAVRALTGIGAPAVPYLQSILADDTADFVIRRRIPRVLARIDDRGADAALITALGAGRFEVRFRVGLALRMRRQRNLAEAPGNWENGVWEAVRAEVGRERPVWELARLLDRDADDDFVEERVGLRGELSLEHTFRLLSLVLHPKSIQAAYRGIVLDDPEVKSFAQEYLEQVLPLDVRTRLWPFIGDLSASAEQRAIRDLDDVVADLLKTGATLFGSPEDREALQRYLQGDRNEEAEPDGPEGPPV
jgi:ATP/ADP translocase